MSKAGHNVRREQTISTNCSYEDTNSLYSKIIYRFLEYLIEHNIFLLKMFSNRR